MVNGLDRWNPQQYDSPHVQIISWTIGLHRNLGYSYFFLNIQSSLRASTPSHQREMISGEVVQLAERRATV